MTLGIRLQAEAGFRDRAFLADAGEHVGQRSPRRVVIEYVVRRDERRTDLGGELGEFSQAAAFVAPV